MRKKHLIVRFWVTVVALLAVLGNGALAQAPFYQGKTLVIVLGTAAGGAGDHRTRALVPSLRKYIPGNPTIVLEHRAGGGGRQADLPVSRGVRVRSCNNTYSPNDFVND
jgi:tripartite-type tricarboxylate transporter receptor subunit TctC